MTKAKSDRSFKNTGKGSPSHTEKSKYSESNKPKRIPWIFPFKRPNFYLPSLRITLPRPPRWIYTSLIMLVIFYIFSGGVYNSVSESVLPYLSTESGGVDLIYTERGSCTGNIGHQYYFEGIVAGLLMFMGALGLYLIYEGSKEPHDPDRAFNYHVAGVILLLICLLILENMMNIKGCVPQN